ncbi:MAG: hypothetical protein IAG10_27175, partial [Planctomycetaceae bacterium]|nr:hypothetical protein [Planctomycetaceae bacterium]
MFFPSFRRQPRRRHRSTQQIEQLEPRELLAAVAQLSSAEVTKLLDRASMATSSNDAIIAVVDRGGHILGVRVEQDVLDALDAVVNGCNGNGMIDSGSVEEQTLVYAIDGAVAKARTAAFFANGSVDSQIAPGVADPPLADAIPTVGPLTSRTIRNISQSTVTQREVQSNPNIADPDSTLRGPGFVAPISLGQHFPPEIPHTPQVDLFGIEHTNRDSIVHPGFDAIKGTADDIALEQRFNIDPAFVPGGQVVDAPESYGFTTGIMVNAQARGIATLPGGVPIFRTIDPATGMLVGLDVVGGIGVFFPGTSDPDGVGPGSIGDATFEQNFPNAQTESERTNAPKVLEAEFTAFYAIGGGLFGGLTLAKDRYYGGDFPIPFGRIDLVGITLQIIGPTVGVSGVRTVEAVGDKIPQGDVKLAVKVNSTATSITVNDGTLLPAAPFSILIDKEVLEVTNVTGNTLTVTRAQSGTAAKSHAAGKAVIAGTVELATAVDETSTMLTVTDARLLPATPFQIRLEKEVLTVTNVDVLTRMLTVVRAQDGSKADKHAVGKQIITSSGQDQLVRATSSVLVALNDSATSLVVPDATGFPTTPFAISLDDHNPLTVDEQVLVTSVTLTPDTLMIVPDTLTIVRAPGAVAHAVGETIRTTAVSTAVPGRAVPEGFLVTPHDSPILAKATSTLAAALGAADLTLVVPDA